MEEYMTSNKSPIFTDDLKTMIHISESDSDIETLTKMILRYHSQRKDLSFSNFVFGPQIMRMLHSLNKDDVALDIFYNKELEGFFDQMSTFIILMDLLHENGRHQDVLVVMKTVEAKQLGGFKYPIDCLTATTASLLKLNTPVAYEIMVKLVSDAQKAGCSVSARCLVYASYLALKQNQPGNALEIQAMLPSYTKGRVPVAVTNVKAMTYAALDRPEQALATLRAELERDVPDHIRRGGEFFKETLEIVKTAVKKSDNKELGSQLDKILEALKSGGHLSDMEFEAYLFRPIIRRRQLQDGYKSRQRGSAGGYHRPGGRVAYRHGLSDQEDRIPL